VLIHSFAAASRRTNPVRLALTCLVLVVIVFTGCITAPIRDLHGSDEPTLSWRGAPATTMAISWFDAPAVEGVELRDATGTVSVFDAEYVGSVTRVLLDGLEPESTYSYRTLSAEAGTTPRWRSFTTAPPAGTPGGGTSDEVFEFAVAGDLQPFNPETVRTTTMVLSKIASLHPAFILQVGDVSEVGISRRSWNLAASVLSVAGEEIPIIAAAGNHDYYYGIRSARNFKTFFPAPYAGGESLRENTWYSQTVGPVHIAVLDTEADGDRFREQADWLVADLSAARSHGARWVFIAMHRPILASATAAENPKWAPALLPLIAEHGVDAVFWGHDHTYEHYEYQYGANGYVFDLTDRIAEGPTHLYTVGTAGARVDNLYAGFFSHRPFQETREMYDLETGTPTALEFVQRAWNPARVKRDLPGIRYQDPAEYPKAASYYSYPFDSAADAEAGRYSTDPEQRYSDDAEFFGYTYGETSIHYLWIEIRGDECIITAHYADGEAGEHGEVITSPDGREERWILN
jgi:calcineurin-like phosphoesterase family protein/purple acid phosphatase-like protein